MKKRVLAFCLIFTMVCSAWQMSVLADEVEENILQQEETTGDSVLEGYTEESLPEDVLDEAMSVFANEKDAWDWVEEPFMQVARSRHTIQAIGDKIYVFGGGNSQNRMLDSVEIFDTITRTWSTGEPMPIAKADFASVVVGNEIYVMGGIVNTSDTATNYTYTNSVEIYNTKTNTWTTGTPLPSARWSGRAIAVDNKIYVIAGLRSGSLADLNNDVDIYDIEMDSWVSGLPMPEEMNRAYSGVAYSEGKIFLIGGSKRTMVVYDIKDDHWSTALMSVFFGYCTASVYDNKIYIIGGDEQFYNIDKNNKFFIYDIESATVTKGSSNFYTSAHHRSAIVNGVLYVLGGESDNIMLTNMVSLRLADITPNQNRLFVLLNISESVQLSLSHNLGINLDYDWSSTDNSVATVNANGYVTAEGEGTCFIYAENEEGYSDYIPIKVMEGNADEIRLAVHLAAGSQAKLYLAEDPGTVNWTSFDHNVVTVDSEGVLKAEGQGLAIVQGEIDGEAYHIYVRVNG